MERSDGTADGGQDLTIDRGALTSLLREVHATHLMVWTMVSGGTLRSTKLPLSDVTQQLTAAGRILERNFDQAMLMVRSASKAFDSTAQRWESQARQSEQQLRSSTNTGKLNQVKGQHNQVRTRIRPVQTLFMRAVRMLEDVDIKRKQQAARDADAGE